MPVRSLAVILNPAAGNRRAGRERARLEAALGAAGLPFEVFVTERPNHAAALARRAAERFDAVVAAGGDGTLQEVASGLFGTDGGTVLGVIPLGTGNDFARLLGVPKRPEAAVPALLGGEIAPVDAGVVRWREQGETRRHDALFVNAVGIGFDALVAAEAARTKWVRGVSGYVAAVLRTLRLWTQPEVEVRSVGAEGTVPENREPLFLASVGNGTAVGGGFRLTPEAQPDDGVLDLCFVAGPLSLARILVLMPKAIRGRHLGEPEVSMRRVRHLALRTEAGLPIHVDGEVLTRSAAEVEVEVQPGAFRMLRPGLNAGR
ncbi:MAG: diacylglycerol kinase family protein [Bacteroidota bacterium]